MADLTFDDLIPKKPAARFDDLVPQQDVPSAAPAVPTPPATPAVVDDAPKPWPDTRVGYSPEISINPRMTQIQMQGVGRTGADILGLPGDFSTGVVNLGLAGVDLLQDVADKAVGVFTGKDDNIPDVTYRFPPSPVGGDSIASFFGDLMRKTGVGPIEYEDMTPEERALYSAYRFGTEGLVGGTALARRAAAQTVGRRAPRMSDAFLDAYRENPGRAVATDTGAGAGAGVALEAQREMVPEEYQGPLLDMASMMLGGFGGASTVGGTRVPRELAEGVRRRLPAKGVPIDPAKGEKAVTNATADNAASFVQRAVREGGGDPDKVSQTVDRAMRDAAENGDPMATTGAASGDIGMAALERAARIDNPIKFQGKDRLLREAAQERVTGLRDDGADPMAARAKIEQETAARRDAVAAPVEDARQELSNLRRSNADRLNETQSQREAALSDREAAVDAAKRSANEADAAERDFGGSVQGPLGTETAASERVAGAVDTAKRSDETTKASLYREAEQAGRETKLDPTPLIDDAKAVEAEISPLADTDPKLKNIIGDLKRLGAESAEPTGQNTPDSITARDLIAMLPRLSDARKAARRLKRGDVTERLDRIVGTIRGQLEDLADSGDQAALKWQEAETNFRDNFAPKYREGVGAELDRAERAGTPTPPSAVAGKFLKPGAGGKEAAADLNRILTGAESEAAGKTAARDYVMADLAKVVGADGKINPARLRSWVASREGMLSQIPDVQAEVRETLRSVINRRAETTRLQSEVEKAVAARRQTDAEFRTEIEKVRNDAKLSEATQQERIADLTRKQAEVEQEINRSAASLLLDADPAVAVKRVLNSADPSAAMKEIVGRLKGDKAAEAGWKRAVVDHLVERVTNTRTATTAGTDGEVSIAKLKQFFDKNDKALAAVFTPEEMNSLRRAHKILEPLQNLSIQATAGSPTAENEMLWNSLEAGLLAVTGNAITTGMIMKRVRVALKFLPDPAKQTAALVERMFFDPELAKTLLTRKVREIESPEWNKRLAQSIAGMEAMRRDASENETAR